MEGIKNANVRLSATFAALGLMLCAFLGLTATAEAADYNNLPDGTYTVTVEMRNYTDPSQYSMSNEAVSNPMTVTVKDGAYYATVSMHGITIKLGPTSFFGYLKELYYWDGSDFQAVTYDSYYDDVVDYYNDTDSDGVADFKYPHQMTFPLVNKASGDQGGYVKMRVFVPIMEGISAGTGTQQVLMKIDWSTLKSVAQPSTPTNPDTPTAPVSPAVTKVTSGKVTYAKSGSAATVSSINKKAKSVSVKSTVKIGGTTYKVTSIAKNAALNAKSLKTITLGKNIKSIGKNAFKGINKKATIKAPKAQLSKYKKLCKKAGAPKTVKYKAA